VYRRELLARLGLPFEVCAANIDESRQPGETPGALAMRLALEKAQAIASMRSQDVVIGADQVLDLNGQALGKPGTHERAREQLMLLSGHCVHFHSAVAVISSVGRELHVSTSRVCFLKLSAQQIEHYLQTEKPYDTAGSAKAEGLGIALLESLQSADPTSIIGLPLIKVSQMLRRVGLDPLCQPYLRSGVHP
jgi:septum formation protein